MESSNPGLGEITGEQRQKHKQIYYPAVRVVAHSAGGSGVCIYSDRDEQGRARSYILTNHHVIEDLIKVEETWDATLKREYPAETLQSASVEFFQYNNYSRAVGSESYQADIVAWDHADKRDIALLELREQEQTMDHVARLMPYEHRNDIFMFDKVHAVGAALGHPVFQTPGEVTNARIEMGQQQYIGTNSAITFGNSGGGLFKHGPDGNYYLIGLPARISLQGFGDVANHIGFAVPVSVIYDFLSENWFDFIWKDDVTIEECDAKRAEMKKEAKQRLLGS